MELLALNLREPAPIYSGRQELAPHHFRLNSANLNQGVWPFKGLVYSFFVHQFGLVTILVVPLIAASYMTPPLPVGDQLFAIDMNSRAKLVYFPNLPAKGDSASPDSEGKQDPIEQQAKPRPLRTKGLTYPGRQAIVSDVPNPTNKFQTLLQPALKPPVIQPPPLPNIIQTADAGPLPKPVPEPTVAKKDLMVPSPSKVAPQRQAVALPNATP